MKQLNFFLIFFLTISILSKAQCPDTPWLGLHSQDDIDQFIIQYPDCQNFNGQIHIQSQGASGGPIQNLNGLSNLVSVSNLRIEYCYPLTDISGLSNLESVSNDLRITNCPALTDLTGLHNLQQVGRDFVILSLGITSIENIFNNLTSTRALQIKSNEFLEEINDFENLTSGSVSIDNPNLINIEGFSNLVHAGSISLKAYHSYNELHTIQAFENLQTTTGGVIIEFPLYLDVEISPFENLTEINLDLSISARTNNFNWFPNLNKIGNSLYLDNGYFLNNSDLSSLENLNEVSGYLKVNDTTLTSLFGLQHIDSESFHSLRISNNSNLSQCSLPNICSFILENPGSAIVYNNALGCNSVQEILDNCNMSVDSQELNKKITVYPNPVKEFINISNSDNSQIIEKVVLLDSSGKILNEFKNQKKINLGFYPSGNYILLIQTNQETISKKISIL